MRRRAQPAWTLAAARRLIGQRVRALRDIQYWSVPCGTPGRVVRAIRRPDGSGAVLVQWEIPPVPVRDTWRRIRHVFTRRTWRLRLEPIDG